MLRFSIQRICKARGIDRPFTYFKSHGYSVSTATRLASDIKQNFSLDTVENLCVLFRCSPNDLLEWTPSKDVTINADHPLNALRREQKVDSVSQLISGASLEKLEQIEAIIKKELGV